MKKFDIKKAKNGAAVCLRDGTPVKILDFDFNGNILYKFKMSELKGEEIVITECAKKTDKEGNGMSLLTDKPHGKYDLFMAPVFAYMNVFKNEDNKVLVGGVIRATREECAESAKTDLMPGTKWFCVARVELLEEEGIGHV